MPDPSPYVICAAPRAGVWGPGGDASGVRRVDPWRVSDAPFVRRVHALHAEDAPADTRPLPAWAMYDCAASSGFIAGLERPEEGQPLTMLAATPCAREGDWHALALRGAPAHLAATLALALRLVHPGRLSLVAPWRDPFLTELARVHRPRVRSAWTPAHPDPASAMLEIDARAPRAGSDGTPTERIALRAGDDDGMRCTQSLIERGHRFRLVGVRSGEITLERERA